MNIFSGKSISVVALAVGLCIATQQTLADYVSPGQAIQVGLNHLNSQPSPPSATQPGLLMANPSLSTLDVREMIAEYDGDTPIYYIFNLIPEGWMIIAANDVAYPMIAYSNEGAWTPDDTPPQCQWWMETVKVEISQAIATNLSPLPNAEEAWHDPVEEPLILPSLNISTLSYLPTVDPLIQTRWDQGGKSTYSGVWYKSYDYYCPWEKNWAGYRVPPTGCVATTMAQIMKYWEWPPVGSGSHTWDPPYQCESACNGYDAYTVDYSQARYNWAIMPEKVGSNLLTGNPSPYEGGLEVALLMRHCGNALNMKYKPGASSSHTSLMVDALKNHYHYNPGATYIPKDSDYPWPNGTHYSTTDWINMLKGELSAGRPLPYQGDNGVVGHSFVCDGYDSANLFHFNWGWSGSKDGYYNIDDLTPGGFDFRQETSAGFYIEPGYPKEVWVNASYTENGDNDGHIWGWDAYSSIQLATVMVDSGGTVNIAEGTYSENIVIFFKPVKLVGAGVDKTHLDGGQSFLSLYFLHAGEGSEVSNIRFIDGNQAGSVYGGAILLDYSTVNITNCAFENNSKGLNPKGGAIIVPANSTATVVNCYFRYNTTAICVDGGDAVITNCTAYKNSTGLNCISGSATATNTIFWDNFDSQIAGSGTLIVSYCDVEGGYPGVGNIDANPSFLDAGAGDLHLTGSSVCIDRGLNAAPALPDIDFDGGARIVNGGVNGNRVDIGCDEYARVLYVRYNATGANNGTSWYDAYTRLQDALSAAVPSTEIWISQGTYYPGASGQRDQSFVLKAGVAVYGGFGQYGYPQWESRDPARYHVTLSGDLNRNSQFDTADAYHVLYAKAGGIGPDTILDGVTITRGNADGAYPDYYGGGIYIESASPTIRNCQFTNNKSTNQGGAISAFNSTMTLESCLFSGNESQTGGAIRFGHSSPIIRDCRFDSNATTANNGHGGAIYMEYDFDSEPGRIESCYFHNNNAISSGGAIYIKSFSTTPAFLISNSVFSSNQAGQYGSGGAIFASSSKIDLKNCTLWNNQVTYNLNFNAHGLFLSSSTATIVNSILWDNTPGKEIHSSSSSYSISYTDIRGGAGGAGNLNSDPMFVDAGGGNLRLTINSPCINKGSFAETLPDDYDGNPRDCLIDLGAYEFQIPHPLTFYVNDNATGGNTGLNWANALTDLTNALKLAEPGDTIWVAAGTYIPSTPLDPGDVRTASFQMKNGVALIGGLAGNEDPQTFDLAQRDITGNLTVLSGDIGTSSLADNCYHVIDNTEDLALDHTAILDGFTITHGYNDLAPDHVHGNGAGICIDSGSPVIRNCRITDNHCTQSNGAGIYVFNGQPEITRCDFSQNVATQGNGGGLYSAYATSVIERSLFIENTGLNGGAFALQQSSASISQCLMRNNTAQNGGAIYHSLSGLVNVNNCTIYDNAATSQGIVQSVQTAGDGRLQLLNSIVWNSSGQPLVIDASMISVQNCDIESSGSSDNWLLTGITDLGGNIDQDPQFDSLAPFHLAKGSPCVDTGHNYIDLPPTDLDNTNRLFDGNCDGQAVVDMGIYEYAQYYPGDINQDCMINTYDLSAFSHCWMLSDLTSCLKTDLNTDGVVDIVDLQVLCNIWLIDYQ